MKTKMRYQCISILAAVAAFLVVYHSEPSQSRKVENENERGTSGAMQALEFWTRARAYPANDIPPAAFMKSYTYAKTRMRKVSAIASDPGWRFMGPANVIGRMLSIAVNPQNSNTILAGSASGGLWRSRSAGLNADWERVKIGYPVLGVAAIAYDPLDSNTIYIGTGEVYRYNGAVMGVGIRTSRGSYGMGILKTTNGGTTWTKSLDWSQNMQTGIQGITINPLNHHTIFAATSEGIYRSSNAGGTWSNVLNTVMARDIIYKTPDTTWMMASLGNFSSPDAGVYISFDGGANWFGMGGLPSFSGYARLEAYQSNTNIVYASLCDSVFGLGSLWVTTDFGNSWTSAYASPVVNFVNQGWYSHYVAVHPLDSSRVVQACVNLGVSSHGGALMSVFSGTYSDHHGYAHDPNNPDVLYDVDDGGVYRSTDFGNTYQDIGAGIQTTQFYNGFSCSATDSNIAFGHVQDHFGWMYRSNGQWIPAGVDETGWTVVSQVNDNLAFAVDRNGNIYKSFSGGGSGNFFQAGSFDGYSAWDTPFLLSPSDNNVLYVGREKIWKTTDGASHGGASWIPLGGALDGNPALSMAMSYTNSDTVYVGTTPLYGPAHLFRTTNGSSWQNITGSTPDRYPLDMAVDPKKSASVYVVYGGFGAGHVWHSTDAGTTWSNITGVLPDVPTSAVMVDPFKSNIVYVGNDIGMYVSTDFGASWLDFNEGLPEALIVMDLQPCLANNTVRLATHGNGVYQRTLYSKIATGIKGDRNILPASFTLEQNYPNPFNPETRIRFELKEASNVTLTIVDVAGRELATLLDGFKQPGTYSIAWNGTSYPSGTYFARLSAGNPSAGSGKVLTQTRKMELVK